MANKVFCEGCRYRRKPVQVDLFSPRELQYPGVSDEWGKWIDGRQARQRAEMEMFDRHEPFYFPPEFFEWCEAWTEAGKADWPVNSLGQTIKVYVLTAHKNQEHDCRRWASVEKDSPAESGPTPSKWGF
jgi:hypothetical protein